MQAHRIEITLTENGKLIWQNLPFKQRDEVYVDVKIYRNGDRIEVFDRLRYQLFESRILCFILNVCSLFGLS